MIKDVDLKIWGRDFTLPVEYDCYSNEKITDEQIQNLDLFIRNKRLIDKSKIYVEDYCEKQISEENKNNIFTYIKPHYIYVKREPNPRVAIMCKYKYDTENGLAIVFDDSGNIKVTIQDEIL